MSFSYSVRSIILRCEAHISIKEDGVKENFLFFKRIFLRPNLSSLLRLIIILEKVSYKKSLCFLEFFFVCFTETRFLYIYSGTQFVD